MTPRKRVDPLDEEVRDSLTLVNNRIDGVVEQVTKLMEQVDQLAKTVQQYHPASRRNCSACGRATLTIGQACTWCGRPFTAM